MEEILQWSGCGSAIIGSLLLASYTRISHVGWWMFLLSNVCWCSYGLLYSNHAIFIMNTVFMTTSLLGLYRSSITRLTKQPA